MNNENQYTEAEILNYMDLNPEADVFSIACQLNITTYDVGQAQHNRMRKIFAKNRNSPLWSYQGYTVPDKKRLTYPDFTILINRIALGETGVYKEACEKYTMGPDFRAKLRGAN